MGCHTFVGVFSCFFFSLEDFFPVLTCMTQTGLLADRIEIVLLNPHNNNPKTLVSELRFFSENNEKDQGSECWAECGVAHTPQPSLLDLCWEGAAVGSPFYLI